MIPAQEIDPELRAKLEAQGEAGVRLNLRKGIYGSRKRPQVEAWLDERERAERRRVDRRGGNVAWLMVFIAAVGLIIAFL